MKQTIAKLLLFLSTALTAFATSPAEARAYLDAANVPARHTWLRAEMEKHSTADLDEWTAMGLAGAAIEMASKHNDLFSYNYLVTRLAISKNDEEKGDIISKLAMWPGMTAFSPTTRRVLASLQSSTQSSDVLAKAGMALAHLDKVPKI